VDATTLIMIRLLAYSFRIVIACSSTSSYISRVGQDRVCTPYMAVYSAIFLSKKSCKKLAQALIVIYVYTPYMYGFGTTPNVYPIERLL
jgi:hypothetical protein